MRLTEDLTLFTAAENGKLDVVQQLLAKGAEVNKANKYRYTALLLAAKRGHVEIVKQLLEAGADVKRANYYGETPLLCAAEIGHVEIVAQLLKAGADVNLASKYGRTPLHIAAQQGKLDVAWLLLEGGADINQADIDGETPLHIAAYFGQLDIAQLLLDRGAEVNKANPYGRTPLHIAAQQGKLDVAQLLLFATKLSARPDVRYTLSPTMSADPIIRQILDCDQGLFRGLRDNLNLIAQADKAGLSQAEPINTSQIVLKALYEHFGRCEDIPQLLKIFIERTSQAQLSRFDLNDPQSLLMFLFKIKGPIPQSNESQEKKSAAEQISSITSSIIAEYVGAFSNERLKALLEAYFNGEEVKDLTTVAAEADKARALTQEGVLAVEYVQPDYIAELITKLESLPSLPDNITKNDDGTYTYNHNAGNGAAELAEKPLNEITEDELTKLNSQIAAILARQQAAQEAGGQAEASTAASPKLSHVARLAEQRAQEEVREPQLNGI